jgi:hypothetical protein
VKSIDASPKCAARRYLKRFKFKIALCEIVVKQIESKRKICVENHAKAMTALFDGMIFVIYTGFH